VPALLVDRNRNSTSRRDQYRKVGLQEAIPRLASIVDDGQLGRKTLVANKIVLKSKELTSIGLTCLT
jgi:hypothetical protein